MVALAVLIAVYGGPNPAWIRWLWPGAAAASFAAIAALERWGRPPSWNALQLGGLALLGAVPLGFVVGAVAGGAGGFSWPLGAAIWGFGLLTAPLVAWGLALAARPLWRGSPSHPASGVAA